MRFSTLSVAALAALANVSLAAPIVKVVVETIHTTVVVTVGAHGPAPTATSTTSSTTEPAANNVVVYTTVVAPEAAAPTTTDTPAAAPAVTTPVIAAAVVETTPAAAPVPTTTEEAATTTAAATTTEAAATTAASSDDSFASAILAEHNKFRALHGVADLTWDETLYSYAQDYANAYDCSGTLTHSGGPYGENLALGYSTTGTVDAWYAEGDGFDYSAGNVYDHFTQVIWKSTTKLGCGYKYCDSYYGTYVVCSYDPAGNFVGEELENVLPLVN